MLHEDNLTFIKTKLKAEVVVPDQMKEFIHDMSKKDALDQRFESKNRLMDEKSNKLINNLLKEQQ